MKHAVVIVLFAAVVIVGGALISPWLFLTVHPYIDVGFRRVFNRALLIVAVAGMWPLLRALGIRSWKEIGWSRRPDAGKQVLIGLGLGLVSLLIAAGISVALGRRTLDWGRPGLGIIALKLCGTAAAVALVEETFFRGCLQRAFQRTMGNWPGLVTTSALYSALHFLKPRGVEIPAESVRWNSGFVCLRAVLENSVAQPDVVVGFVSLLLAGMILGWAFSKTGTLYLSMGLHAGWVLPNELIRKLGGGMIIKDWLVWPVLLVLFGMLAWRCGQESQNGERKAVLDSNRG